MGGGSSSQQKKTRTKKRCGDMRCAVCSSSRIKTKNLYAEREISRVRSLKKGIETLPAEIKVFIFSYLTPEEICRSVAPVCKYWYILSKTPSLWLRLCLRLSSWKSTAHLNKKLSQFPLLQELVIFGKTNGKIDEERVLEKPFPCPQLTFLSIQCAKVSNSFLKGLASSNPLIETLELIGHSSDEQTLENDRWENGLSQLRNLKCLVIDFNAIGMNEVAIDVIIKSCSSLQTLILMSVFLSNQNLQDIASCLRDTLRVLVAVVKYVTTEGFLALSACVRLDHVGLCLARTIDDKTFDALAPLPLKLFHISPDFALETSMNVSNECLIRFFSNTHRTLLELMCLDGFPEFDDRVIRAVADNCPNLLKLEFPRCEKVTDDGLIYLLTRIKKLQTLDADQTQVTQDLLLAFEARKNWIDI